MHVLTKWLIIYNNMTLYIDIRYGVYLSIILYRIYEYYNLTMHNMKFLVI